MTDTIRPSLSATARAAEAPWTFQSPANLTRLLRLALWTHIATLIFSLGAAAIAINLRWRVKHGAELTPGELHGVAQLVRLVGSAQLFAFAALGVIFLLWLFRVRRNVRPVHEMQMRWTLDWTMWSWAVPFINLYAPFQAIADIWRASWARPHAELKNIRLPRFFLFWWAATLAAGGAGLASYAVLNFTEHLGLATLILNLLPMPLLIVKNLLDLKVAKSIAHPQITYMAPSADA